MSLRSGRAKRESERNFPPESSVANWGFHRTMDVSEVTLSLKTPPSIGNNPAALYFLQPDPSCKRLP